MELFFLQREQSNKSRLFRTLFQGLLMFFQKWTFINVQFSFGGFKLGFNLLNSLYTIANFKFAISITSLTHNCSLRERFECAKV